MKHRLTIWAAVGFLIACCWVLYTFLASPEQMQVAFHQPLVELGLAITLPASLLRHFPIPFWVVPPANAAIYALVGSAIEALRQSPRPHLA